MKGKNTDIDRPTRTENVKSKIVVEGDKENSNSRPVPNGNSSIVGKTGKESPPAKMESK